MEIIIRTPLSPEELHGATLNYLYPNYQDIPPEVIDKFVAQAAEEHMEKFCSDPEISPFLTEQIELAIEKYYQENL